MSVPLTADFVPIPLPDFVEHSPDDMQRRAEAFYEGLRRRHTVREFSNRPVPRSVIETCLTAAGTAPSGANHQPWHFSVIGNAAMKSRIRAAAEEEERAFYGGRAGVEWLAALKPLGTDQDKPFLDIAPWLICVFGARKSRSADGVMRKNYYVPESVSIATGFLIAALHHAGLDPDPYARADELPQPNLRASGDGEAVHPSGHRVSGCERAYSATCDREEAVVGDLDVLRISDLRIGDARDREPSGVLHA